MKIAVFILNALIQFAAAAFGFFIMLIGLNGFSEEASTPGLLLYIVLSIITVLGIGAGSAFAAHRLTVKLAFGKIVAAAIAVPVFAVIGAIVLVVALFAAVLLVQALG